MKSFSNCSNAGELNIDLSNLFCSKLCLSPSNDHINSLKDYGNFAEENKQCDSRDSQHYDTHLMMLQVGVNSKKEDLSHLFIKLI